MMNYSHTLALALISTLAMTACGGGSTSAPPTTPPTQTNTTPTVTINVTNMSPNEGLTSTLDGSGSSDADGDNLTFSWTQLSGPDLKLSSPTASVTDVFVPNLTDDEMARIQLQVSDGKEMTTQEVTLTLKNVVLSPIANSTNTSEFSFDYPNTILTMLSAGRFSLTEFVTDNYFLYQEGNVLKWDHFSLNNQSANDAPVISPRDLQFEAGDLDNVSQRIEVFKSAGTRSFPIFSVTEGGALNLVDAASSINPVLSVDIENPCTAALSPETPQDLFRPISSGIIGLYDGGAKIFDYSGDGIDGDFQRPIAGTEVLLEGQFGGDASYCEMVFTNKLATDLENSFTSELLAFDQKTNRVVHYQQEINPSDGTTDALIEIASAPVELNLPENVTVDFVTSARTSFGGFGALALVYSDRKTQGNHRLVIVSLGDEHTITQETLSWDYGVPTSIVRDSLTTFTFEEDEERGHTFIITTKDSPYSIIYKSAPILSGATSYFPFSGPSYYDLGVGHGLVTPFQDIDRKPRTLVTYPDENRIRLITR